MQTPALPLGYVAIWSGKRGSNSRPPPWQGGALPLSYFRIQLNLSKAHYALCHLEATPRIELGNRGFADPGLTAWLCRHKWSGKRGSNSRPPPWQGGALPLSYFRVATRMGLEPMTSAVTGRHSNQLNYRAVLPNILPLSQRQILLYRFTYILSTGI